MKLSKKELRLVAVMLIVLIGAAFYFFIYQNLEKELVAARQSKEEAAQKISDIEARLAKKDDYDQVIRDTDQSIKKLSPRYYGELNQDTFVMIVNEITKASQLDVKSMDLTNNQINISELLRQADMMPPDGQLSFSVKPDTEQFILTDQVLSEEIILNSALVNFNGSYDQLNSFLDMISDYPKRVVVDSMSLTRAGDDNITGTMSLGAMNVPSLDAFIDDNYLSNYFVINSFRDDRSNIFQPYDYYSSINNAIENSDGYVGNNFLDFDIGTNSQNGSDAEVTATSSVITEPTVQIATFNGSNYFFVGGDTQIRGSATTSNESRNGSKSIKVNYRFADYNRVNQANVAFVEQALMNTQLARSLRLTVKDYAAKNNALKIVLVDAKAQRYNLTFTLKTEYLGWQYFYTEIPAGVSYPFMVQRIYVQGEGIDQQIEDTFYIDELSAITGLTGGGE